MTSLTRTSGLAAALLLGTALPALAQAGLCGGVGDAGQWLGGDEASSDVATSGDYLEQMALVLMNNEYVGLFSVSAAGEYRMEAQANGAGDTVIDIRDAAGNIVATDDDSGGNGASMAQQWLEPGQYCLSMRSYDGAPLTGMVRVSRPEQAQLTAGFTGYEEEGEEWSDDWGSGGGWPAACAIDQVQAWVSDAPVDDQLSAGITVSASQSQTQFWGFTLAAPAAVTITAQNTNADPAIALYDQYGGWLAENDDYNSLDSQIDVTNPLPAGQYCISVGALSDSSLPINIGLSAYDPAAAAIGSYERGEASPPLDGSYPITQLGELGNRVRQDAMTSAVTTWYSFDVREGGLLVIEAVTNGMGDPVLVLFDDFGRQVAYNDDANNTLDSMISTRVLPGTYVVGVRQYGDSSIMTRLLFERYVPAQ